VVETQPYEICISSGDDTVAAKSARLRGSYGCPRITANIP
jgi:hypothetical protein